MKETGLMFKLSKIQIVSFLLSGVLSLLDYLFSGPVDAFYNILLFITFAAVVSRTIKAEDYDVREPLRVYSKTLRSFFCGLKKPLYIAYLNWMILLFRLKPIPLFLILVAITIYLAKFDVSPMARYCFYCFLFLLLLSGESYKIIKYFKKRNRK